MYHIKIQSYIGPDPFPLLQRDYISSIFPFRIARRKDTVARYKSINIAVYDSIPFSVSTRLIVFWIVAIFLFISPAHANTYIYTYIDIRIDLDFAANVHRTIRRKGGVKLLQRHTTARAENSSVQHACVSRQVRATAKNVQLF